MVLSKFQSKFEIKVSHVETINQSSQNIVKNKLSSNNTKKATKLLMVNLAIAFYLLGLIKINKED